MSSIKNIFCVIFLTTFWTGCVSYENDLARQGKAAVEIIPPKVMVKISDVHVLKKDNGVEVVGSVKRTGLGIMRGHIDIATLSPEKMVLGKASVQYVPEFRRIYPHRREMRPSSFSASFPDGLPIGSMVRIAYHPEKLRMLLDCGNNQALL